MDVLIDSKQPAKYDEAVNLLIDLQELSNKAGEEDSYNDKLNTICQKHHRKSTFLQRLKKVDLIS